VPRRFVDSLSVTCCDRLGEGDASSIRLKWRKARSISGTLRTERGMETYKSPLCTYGRGDPPSCEDQYIQVQLLNLADLGKHTNFPFFLYSRYEKIVAVLTYFIEGPHSTFYLEIEKYFIFKEKCNV
jgi:hypothetical protein